MALIDEQVKRAFAAAADFLVPPTCPNCSAIVSRPGGLCAACWADMPVLPGRPCVSCGLKGFDEDAAGSACDCRHLPQIYHQRRAVWAYDGVAKRLILRLKHGDRPDIAADLARLLRGELAGIERECDVIVPVPIHWRRFTTRRYNQAEMIGKSLSELTGLPMSLDLTRHRATPPQSGGHNKRVKNVRDAFHVAEDFAGKRVLLVDDVMTTGATLAACAAILKDAGAEMVHYAVLAAVPPRRGG